jgi:uncharacterized protein
VRPSETEDVAQESEPSVEERAAASRLGTSVSWVLRGGVLLSFLVIAVGLVVLLISTYAQSSHPGLAAVFPPPRGHAEVLRSPIEVLSGLSQGDPNAVVILGLMILLATPIVQVVVSALTFLMGRDWTYLAITGFVLAILTLSFFVGAAG